MTTYDIYSARARARARLKLLELSGADFSGLAKYKKDPIGFITEFLGEELTDEQKQIAIAITQKQEVNVQAAHGVGKCVAATELITLANGLEIPAGELVNKDFSLPVLINGKVKRAPAIAELNAIEPVYEVITESGRRIIRNGAHPLYSGSINNNGDIKSPGWANVDQLRIHVSACAVPSTLPIFGDEQLGITDIQPENKGKYLRLKLPPNPGTLSYVALRILLSKLFSSHRWLIETDFPPAWLVLPCESREESEAIQRLLLRFGVNTYVTYMADVNTWVNITQGQQDLQRFASEIDINGLTGVIQLACDAVDLRSQFLDFNIPFDRETSAPAGTHWERVFSIQPLEVQQTIAISVPGIETYLTTYYEHNSHLGSRLILWGVFCLRGMAISTAPTERQVKEILWKYVRACYDQNDHRFGGSRGELFVKLTETARAFGFTARHTSSDGFQGIHAEDMLLIEDEASGISEQIDDGAVSCITGQGNTLLRIGNPISIGTPFQKACRVSHIRIPVWNHPNVAWAYQLHEDGIHRLRKDVAALIVTDAEKGIVLEQDQWPDRLPRDRYPGAVSVQWIEKIRAKKGESSPFWESRVEGRFPQDSPFAAIPRKLLIEARARYDTNQAYWDQLSQIKPAKRWGLDVGDGGDDHGLTFWDGPVWREVDLLAGLADHLDTKRAAQWAARKMRSHFPDTPRPYATIMVDNIGVGAGTLADLKADYFNAVPSGWGDAPRDSHGRKRTKAAKAAQVNDAEVFKNEKARQFWALRDALVAKEIAIAPLGEYEEKVFDELSLVFYEETPKGEIKMEDKRKTIKRVGYSPNMADAAVEGFNSPKQNMTPLKAATQPMNTQDWMTDLGL